jgi:hypothetical protein
VYVCVCVCMCFSFYMRRKLIHQCNYFHTQRSSFASGSTGARESSSVFGVACADVMLRSNMNGAAECCKFGVYMVSISVLW